MDSKAYSEYKQYCYDIKYNNRFFISSKVMKYFDIYINENVKTLEAGNIFYRARINKESNKHEVYSDNEIGMPKSAIINSPGRGNPSGINYFYTSSNEETCCSEVRPHIKDVLTVAKYKNSERLKILIIENLATVSDEAVIESGESLSAVEVKSRVDDILYFMLFFMNDFSRVIKNNHYVEYTPYQFFVELCKNKGLDGIRYDSAVMKEGENFNYIFFNDSRFILLDKELRIIKALSYDISKCTSHNTAVPNINFCH